jgi:rRNA maturation endonuclease Nob1
MPKLKSEVNDLEGVDERFRALYEEKDGKFVLDESIYEGLIPESEVKGLAQNKDEILSELRTVRGKLKEIEPDYKKLKEAEDKRAEEKAKAEGDFQALMKQNQEKHEKALQDRQAEIEALTNDLITEKVTKTATAAIAKAKGSVTVLLPHVERSCRCTRGDDGNWRVEVLGKDGKPRLTPGKGNDLMTIDELVSEMKDSDEYAMCFEGNGATGGGSPGTHGSGGSPIVLKGADARDPEKYRLAKAEAEKRGTTVTLQE